MGIQNNKADKQSKRQIEEYQKHPMINLADSMNRSMIGEPGELTKGSWLTKIITAAIILGLLFFLVFSLG